MLKSFRVHRLVTMLAIFGVFGIGQFIMGLPEAMANPQGIKTNVVIMDCSETEEDTFEVEDISSTKDVGIETGDDCAFALQTLLSSGFKIIPGGGGAVHDPSESNEHILYTLVKSGFGIGSNIFPKSFNFPKP